MFLEWSRLKFTESGDPLTGGRKIGVAVPSTVRRWGDHVYISLPRWKVGMGSVVYVVIHSSPQDGVVATLARVRIPPPDLPLPAAPLLQPFPSIQMNLEGDCNALQNVDAIEVGTQNYIPSHNLVSDRSSRSPLGGRLWSDCSVLKTAQKLPTQDTCL